MMDSKNQDRVEEKEDDRQQNYGWGNCEPAALQVLNSPKAALGFLSCAIFTQGMTVNGLARSVVTTLERRFHLTSTDMGAVLIANDVANFLSSLPISYLGADNKPRWLGCGMLLLALGALVFALPHFVAEPYRPVPTTSRFVAEPYRPVPTTSHFVAEPYRPVPTTSHELCHSGSSALTNMSAADSTTWEQTGCGNTTDGSDLRVRVTGYKYVLVLGKFLVGTGACALFSLGVTYINENTPSSQSSVYLGVFYSFSIVGPAVGYLLAGAFLTIPTENSFPTTIGPDDPHWVGAWWVGFLLTAALAVVAAIFILGLPKRLPSKDESGSSEDSPLSVTLTEASLDEAQQEGDKNGDSDHIQLPSATAPPVQNGDRSILRDVSDKSSRLLRNRAFVFLSMATVTEKALFAGIATFTAKYIENQFRTTAGEAALLMGVVSIPGATVGTLLGGYLVKKLRLQVRGIVQMCAGFTLMAAVSSLVLLIRCQDIPLAGVNAAYHNSSHRPASVQLEDGCNARCGCSRDQYHPVCGSDGLVYFSPCHAGCQERELNSTSGALLYANCTCVTPGGLAVPGRCPVGCPLEALFLTVLFFTSVLMFITMIPLLTATLRVVTEEDGPFATGVQDVMVRGLGFIPSILLVGSVIDRACVLQASPCANGGSCLLYNNRQFDVYLVAVCLAYKTASLLFYAIVLLFGQNHEHVDYKSI